MIIIIIIIITIRNGDTNHQRISTGIGEHGNNWTNKDHPNYSIVEIGQNTKKSPGNLRRLAVTQTPVENHQLSLA